MARYVVRTNPAPVRRRRRRTNPVQIIRADEMRPGDAVDVGTGRVHVIEGPFRSGRGVRFRDVRGEDYVLRPSDPVHLLARNNPRAGRSSTRVLAADLERWAASYDIRPMFQLQPGRPGVPGVLWFWFAGAGPSNERELERIAHRHGFEVYRDAAAFAFYDPEAVAAARAAARRNPGRGHTKVGKKFDDCVRAVRGRGGVASPEGVCAASLWRSGQGPALQRAAAAGRRRKARR